MKILGTLGMLVVFFMLAALASWFFINAAPCQWFGSDIEGACGYAAIYLALPVMTIALTILQSVVFWTKWKNPMKKIVAYTFTVLALLSGPITAVTRESLKKMNNEKYVTVNVFNYTKENLRSVSVRDGSNPDTAKPINVMVGGLSAAQKPWSGDPTPITGYYETGSGSMCCTTFRAKAGERVNIDIRVAVKDGQGDYYDVKTWAYWPKNIEVDLWSSLTFHIYPDWHVEIVANDQNSQPPKSGFKAGEKAKISDVVVVTPIKKTPEELQKEFDEEQKRWQETHDLIRSRAIDAE